MTRSGVDRGGWRLLEERIGVTELRFGMEVADDVRRNIVKAGRVDTGRMRSRVSVRRFGSEVRVGVFGVDYAYYQEEGTRYVRGAHFVRDAAVKPRRRLRGGAAT